MDAAIQERNTDSADSGCAVILLTVMIAVFPNIVAECGGSPEACVGGCVAATVSDGYNCLTVHRIAVGGVDAYVAQRGLVASRGAECDSVGSCSEVGKGIFTKTSTKSSSLFLNNHQLLADRNKLHLPTAGCRLWT